MTPDTVEQTALEKDGRPNTRPVMQREPLDVINRPGHILNFVFGAQQDFLLHGWREFDKIVAVAADAHDKILI